MKLRVFFLLSVACMVQASYLPPNGDFTNGLASWLYESKEITVDPLVKAGNLPAVLLPGPSEIRQNLQLEENTIYELSFLAKGEGIDKSSPAKKGARIILHGGKRWERVTDDGAGRCMVGTFDWVRIRHLFSTKAFGTGKVCMKAVLDTQGNFRVADFNIVRVKEDPPNPVSPTTTPVATKPLPDSSSEWFRETFLQDFPLPSLYPTDEAYGFVSPGDKAIFRLYVNSTAELSREFTVRDEDGHMVYQEMLTPCKPDSMLEIPGQKRGYYVVEVTIFANRLKAARVQGGFAVVLPQERSDPFFQINHFGVYPGLLAGYHKIGAGSINLPLEIKEDTSPEKYVNNRFNNYYKCFFDSGLPISLCILAGRSKNTAPAELVDKGYPLLTRDWLQKLEALVAEAAKQLKGKVTNYDVIMEVPSAANMRDKHAGTWTEAMSQLFFTARIVSRTIRAIDPKVNIAVGGCNVQQSIDPYEKIIMTDLENDFDQYNLDAYTGNWNLTTGRPSPPERNLRSFYFEASALAASLGKTPMIRNTETGYAIYYGSRYDQGLAVLQAALTARILIISKSAPVSSVAIFRVGTTYGGTFENNTELCMTTVWKPMRADNKLHHVPLPGGAVFATAAKELAFVNFKREIVSGDRVAYAYVFERPDGLSMAALWQIEDTGLLTMTMETPARRISMTGTEQQIPAGEVKLLLNEKPFYLITEEPVEQLADRIAGAINAARPAYRVAAKLIGASEVRVFFINNTKDSAEFQCGGKSIKVIPGSFASLDCEWNPEVALKATAPDGTILHVPVASSTINAKRLTSEPKFDGSGSWLPASLAGTLSYPDNIQPEQALQPERGYFRNSFNPDGHNISADYFLAYDSKNLYLAVLVDDPVHQQRRTGKDIWHDDSLQLAVANRPAPPATVRSLNTSESSYMTDLNFGAALTSTGSILIRYFPKTKAMDYPVQVTRKDNKTFYEVALPWQALDCNPLQPVYFGFAVFDNNKPSVRVAPYWLESSRGIVGGRDDAQLPLVIFQP